MATGLDLSPFNRVRFVTPDGTLTPEGARALAIVQLRLGGVLGTVYASTLIYIPSGALTAINVQDAIDELESNKATKTALLSHTANVSNPHATTAAQVGAPSGSGTSTGTNTGDETTATIKTKLGITTLSGSNTGDQTTVTGNAGTATALQTARTISGVSFNGTADITLPVGYITGAGGTVTQATSKSTGVTLNKACGEITMDAAALAAGALVMFTLTNSTIGANDSVVCHRKSGGTAGAYDVFTDSVAAGSCVIGVRNTTAGSLSEAVKLTFSVSKGVVA